MASNVFHSDFYIGAATAIPVLWLTSGLASGAVGAIVRNLRIANVSLVAKLLKFPFSIVSISIPFPFGVLAIASEAGVTFTLGPDQTQPVLIGLFAVLLVGGGAFGEILSFVVLWRQRAAPWQNDAVFASVCLVTLLSAIIMLVAIATAASSVQAKPGAGSDGGALERPDSVVQIPAGGSAVVGPADSPLLI